MKTLVLSITACASVFSSAAFAADTWPMPVVPAVAASTGIQLWYFDEVHAKLISNGYRNVRVVDANSFRLAAYDMFGSEIMMVVHPTNRTITRWNYVQQNDK